MEIHEYVAVRPLDFLTFKDAVHIDRDDVLLELLKGNDNQVFFKLYVEIFLYDDRKTLTYT